MKPSQLSKSLHAIASKIDRSKNPSRVLVSKELRKIVARLHTSGSKPVKPSQLDERTTKSNGDPTFTHLSWYMAYQDPNSTEYPVVVFMNDHLHSKPNDPSSSVLVLSFTSQAEYDAWTAGENPNPQNTESIDPEDADELANRIQLFDTSSFE